jgi:hypothetical protein
MGFWGLFPFFFNGFGEGCSWNLERIALRSLQELMVNMHIIHLQIPVLGRFPAYPLREALQRSWFYHEEEEGQGLAHANEGIYAPKQMHLFLHICHRPEWVI